MKKNKKKMNKLLLIWILMNFVFHTFKLDGDIAGFIYFNSNNILLLFIVNEYYHFKKTVMALAVRNYCLVKIIIELLLLMNIGNIGSTLYVSLDIAVIFLTFIYGFYIKKYT